MREKDRRVSSSSINDIAVARGSVGTDRVTDLLADRAALDALLDLRFAGNVTDLVAGVFERPVADLLGRPCKKIRGRLVEVGFRLAQPHVLPSDRRLEQCSRLVDAIEYLHAGSLAVDDVQDGSKMRRGQPSLHLKHGLPIALNVGNWLYFHPLEIIASLGLSDAKELALYRIYHRTLLRAHLGQALDIGLRLTDLSQDRVPDACLAAMELKSGALFSLALMMGAILGDASAETLGVIERFGHGFGIGLQMFDDVGNLLGRAEPAKRWEDLVLRRPTWIWVCAARSCNEADYRQFVGHVRQLADDRRALQSWLDERKFLDAARVEADRHLMACQTQLDRFFGEPAHENALGALRSLADEIRRAYA